MAGTSESRKGKSPMTIVELAGAKVKKVDSGHISTVPEIKVTNSEQKEDPKLDMLHGSGNRKNEHVEAGGARLPASIPPQLSRTESFRKMVERNSWEGKDASCLSNEWSRML